jgi:REP element-mobilizing transposase RayT
LREYDYGQTGAYFVTICTCERRLFFERDAVCAIAERCWLEIPDHFTSVVLDEWVVMPNHIHGIIVLTDPNDDAYPSHRNVNLRIGDDGVDPQRNDGEPNVPHRRGVQLNAPTSNLIDGNANHRNIVRNSTNRHSLISPHRNTLAVIVRTYKAAVTTLCRKDGYTDFQWQRSYYERVIRDDSELNRTRQYIIENPANWNQDEHHPHR